MSILSKNAVVVASFAYAGSFDAVCKAVAEQAKAGVSGDDIYRLFVIGQIGRVLAKGKGLSEKIAADAALAFDDKKNKLRSNARRMWSRVSSVTGVKTSEKRGRKAGAKVAPKAGKAGKAAPKVIKAAPAVKSGAEAVAHVRNMAMMLSTFCKKNESVITPELSALVASFVGDVNKLT